MDSPTLDPPPCPYCGCDCTAFAFAPGCGLGRRVAFADQDANQPPAFVHGQPATFEQGIAKAGDILGAAHFPAILGMDNLTCEGQRMAVAIADRIGACVDTPAVMAPLFPDLGTVACTLGEVKNRADLIVFWGGRPEMTHPRLAEQFAGETAGRFVPHGSVGRMLIVVGEPATADTFRANLFLRLTPGQDFAALWLLRALVQDKPVDPSLNSVAGVAVADWRAFAERLWCCRFGVLFLDPTPPTSRRASEAAHGLATDVNARTRFYAIPLRGPGNGLGAEQVATWQTGYPGAVGLHRRYPRSFGDEFAAQSVLARGEADAALVVGGDPLTDFPPPAREHLGRIPVVALSPRASETTRSATVVLTTAACATHSVATAFRLDGLALPLRPASRSSFPDSFRVLSVLAHALRRDPARA